MNSLVTRSFKCRPSHARLKMILVWSAVRFRAEADVECSGMGLATDGAPAQMGTCPWKEGNERPPPPIPGEEASIGYGQKITLQGQYHQRVI